MSFSAYTPFSRVFIFDFEQVNTRSVYSDFAFVYIYFTSIFTVTKVLSLYRNF